MEMNAFPPWHKAGSNISREASLFFHLVKRHVGCDGANLTASKLQVVAGRGAPARRIGRGLRLHGCAAFSREDRVSRRKRTPLRCAAAQLGLARPPAKTLGAARRLDLNLEN